MLAYILAIVIAFTSISLYLSAFLLPKLHRQDDFLWSGVGLFYALVLWICAERITGGILLGQLAAVILVVSFGWQTVQLRRVTAYPENQTALTGFSVLRWVKNRLGFQINSTTTNNTPSPIIETGTDGKELLTREFSQPVSKEISTEEKAFLGIEETFIQESTEGSAEESTEGSVEESTEGSVEESTEGSVEESTEGSVEESTEGSVEESTETISLIEETEIRETSSEKVSELLISDEELPSSLLIEKPTETPIVETETKSGSSTPVELELKKHKKKNFPLMSSLRSLFKFRNLNSQPQPEIITKSSNRQELDVNKKEDSEKSDILNKPEPFEAISKNTIVVEDEITEIPEEQDKFATQQVKENNFDFSEQPRTIKTILEETEITPEINQKTFEIEQLQEDTQETLKEPVFSEKISREEFEKILTMGTDDQSKTDESLTRKDLQEIKLDTDSLETESSSFDLLEMFAQDQEEDKQSDGNNEKSS